MLHQASAGTWLHVDEVGALLTLDAACACNETRMLAVRKLGLIEQKMADLAAMRQALGGLVLQCDAGDGHNLPNHRRVGRE